MLAAEFRIGVADPTEQGDGTLSPAILASKRRGPLPATAADVAAKAAANQVSDRAARSGALQRASATELADAGGATIAPRNPEIVGGLNFAGQFDRVVPDATGAIGADRSIQAINSKFGIYNHDTGALIGSGTLQELAGHAATVSAHQPQIIWDATTGRFYYAMLSLFTSNDHRLSFGYSRTSSPSSAADFCHYDIYYVYEGLDAPKLGDSRDFIIVGVNVYRPDFIRSDLMAVGKPRGPLGAKCLSQKDLNFGWRQGLRDSQQDPVFTPTPANEIDTFGTGYAVARNLAVPSDRLWFFSVTRDPYDHSPVFGDARLLTLPVSYAVPADATQPARGGDEAPKLTTGYASPSQAVLAVNPSRQNALSFWTQQTVRIGTSGSGIRWYEIDPVAPTPTLARNGVLFALKTFPFNAAISPDRARDTYGNASFGDSFVLEYNASSASEDIVPRIVSASSFKGAGITFRLVRNGVDPYRSDTCSGICAWGSSSSATPDQIGLPTDRGVVWGTNVFASRASSDPTRPNWRSQIFALEP